MTDPGTDTQQRIGRVLFRIGIGLLAIAVCLAAVTVMASALTLSSTVAMDLGRLSGAALIVGILLLAVGLIVWKMPRGIEGDGLWVLKTGPFIRAYST